MIRLTKRERQIARMIRDEGVHSKLIADVLGIKFNSAKAFSYRIMKKLGANSLAEIPGMLLLPLDSPLRRKPDRVEEWSRFYGTYGEEHGSVDL